MIKLAQQHGFTLIELLIVVAILGILASVAGPSFNDLIEEQRLAAVVEAIHSDIRYARSESIKRSNNVSITFTDTAVAPATAWSAWQYVISDASGTIKTVNSTQFSVAFLNTNETTITFSFVRGTANDGTVTITANDGSSGTVTVNAIGRVISSY